MRKNQGRPGYSLDQTSAMGSSTTINDASTLPENCIWISEGVGQPFKPMNKEKFAKDHGFTWTKSMINQKKQRKCFKKPSHSQTIQSQIEFYSSHLGLVYMGEGLGYGVVAVKDIPEGVYISQYVGERKPVVKGKLKDHHNTYALSICSLSSASFTICAEKYRSFSAFFQHLPASPSSYESFRNHKLEFAVENLIWEKDEEEVPTFKTKVKIRKGEIIGFDYGSSYWLALDITPVLFSLTGIVIEEKYFSTEFGIKICLKNGSIITFDFNFGKFLMSDIPYAGILSEELGHIYYISAQQMEERLYRKSGLLEMSFNEEDFEPGKCVVEDPSIKCFFPRR